MSEVKLELYSLLLYFFLFVCFLLKYSIRVRHIDFNLKYNTKTVSGGTNILLKTTGKS